MCLFCSQGFLKGIKLSIASVAIFCIAHSHVENSSSHWDLSQDKVSVEQKLWQEPTSLHSISGSSPWPPVDSKTSLVFLATLTENIQISEWYSGCTYPCVERCMGPLASNQTSFNPQTHAHTQRHTQAHTCTHTHTHTHTQANTIQSLSSRNSITVKGRRQQMICF